MLRLQTGNAVPPAATATPTTTPTATPSATGPTATPTVTFTPSATPTTTPTATPEIPPSQARITLLLDAQPDSIQNFRFTAALENFQLDDATPDDNDAMQRQQRFIVDPGVYTFTAKTPKTWFLTAIQCDPTANGAVDLTNGTVTITVVAGDDVTCTFVNQRGVTLRTITYQDSNGNGRRNQDEPYLADWQVLLYGEQGEALSTQSTNGYGKANFNYLAPTQSYELCEMVATPWVNTQPNTLDETLNQPCYAPISAPGAIVTVWFGNHPDGAVPTEANPAEVNLNGVPGPDVPFDDAGYTEGDYVDEDLTTPPLDQAIFLPVVAQP
ncbi:MAG: hypothetical protein R3E79_46530 [Caldilineaceae bacterium]